LNGDDGYLGSAVGRDAWPRQDAGQPAGVLPMSRLACWLARAGVPSTIADQGPAVAESSLWEWPG